MLHDSQSSHGLFGGFAYAIAASDVAARADANAAIETEPAAPTAGNHKTLIGLVRDFTASIARPPHTQTA